MDNKLWGHFDKLLLATLFVLSTGMLLWVVHHFPESETLHWLQNAVGQILAALLTLMVGQRAMPRKGDTTDSNGTRPTEPQQASPSPAATS